MSNDSDDSIRKKYEEYGVKEYYEKHAPNYTNPHSTQVKDLLIRNHTLIDCSRVLDLCCGNGEVSQVLIELGYNNIMGCDPYTCENYKENIKKKCFPYDFDDIIQGKLNHTFSSVICSFGLHLCEKSKLYAVIGQLLSITDTIVIITPHKRPELENICNLKKVYADFVLTPRGKKVRLKIYRQGD
ncbi:MAG: hypothetical protein ACFFBD_06455 [Candidatus Hodarchaeota archaeon]